MNAPILTGDSITLVLGGRTILNSTYIDAIPGVVTALVGRSGAGKTTLFNILVGRRRADRGQVRWQGQTLQRPSLPALARRGLFYHPDVPWLARHLTFIQHVALLGNREWESVADIFGIMGWIDRKTGTLSDGELRLTELAFGFVLRPSVALLDEPFRGLEPLHRERVGRLLRVFTQAGAAVLYADHDVEAVRRTTDRLFSIEEGGTRLIAGFRERPVWEWYHNWAR